MSPELELLASKDSYFAPLRYITGRIVEYDIKSANISMLKKYGIINDEYYNYLSNLPKNIREVEIGLRIRDEQQYSSDHSSITYTTISNGIKEAKRMLFDSNDIKYDEVIRIARDAVYINRQFDLQYTVFDNVIEFRKKVVADAVIKLSNSLIIFFWHNENGLNLDIKGLGNNEYLHQDYMLSFIGSVLLTAERAGISDALNLISSFYKDYINRTLDIRFYRELNPDSLYKIEYSNYYVSLPNSANDIDISFNANIIRELWSILINKYN